MAPSCRLIASSWQLLALHCAPWLTVTSSKAVKALRSSMLLGSAREELLRSQTAELAEGYTHTTEHQKLVIGCSAGERTTIGAALPVDCASEKKAFVLWREMKKLHGLRGWTFEVDHAVRRNGCCRYSSKRISTSRHFLNSPEATRHWSNWSRRRERLGQQGKSYCDRRRQSLPKGTRTPQNTRNL